MLWGRPEFPVQRSTETLEPEKHVLPGSTTDTWRTWLMTGARHAPVDRRRVRGEHMGLKRVLLEGMADMHERPHAWKDFSGAMIRHAIDEAMRSLPAQDTQVVKLAYFGGYSNKQIADQVGLTEATVQRRLKRALSNIANASREDVCWRGARCTYSRCGCQGAGSARARTTSCSRSRWRPPPPSSSRSLLRPWPSHPPVTATRRGRL